MVDKRKVTDCDFLDEQDEAILDKVWEGIASERSGVEKGAEGSKNLPEMPEGYTDAPILDEEDEKILDRLFATGPASKVENGR